MPNRKLWGELEGDGRQDSIQNVNFNPIIDLAMQNIPEIPITVKSAPIELPERNLITHTIELHKYYKSLSVRLEQLEIALLSQTRIDTATVPPLPPDPILQLEHEPTPPIRFIEKDFCDFFDGYGPNILPFTPESHQRALKQCAAIAIGHVGFSKCSNTAMTAVADSLDHYMTNMCKSLRSVVDKEAGGTSCGFADPISKVLTELNVGNLHEFYEVRVIEYHKKIKNKCIELKEQCEALIAGSVTPEIKLEEVPELHFPAALDGAFTPSLEPGFQMLQSLEQEQLQGLDLLDGVSVDDIASMEYTQPESVPKLASVSPTSTNKKKK